MCRCRPRSAAASPGSSRTAAGCSSRSARARRGRRTPMCCPAVAARSRSIARAATRRASARSSSAIRCSSRSARRAAATSPPRGSTATAPSSRSRARRCSRGSTRGAPALLERRVGNGRVLLWTSTLDLSWSDLPLKPIYLPFVHQAVRHLASYAQPAPWLHGRAGPRSDGRRGSRRAAGRPRRGDPLGPAGAARRGGVRGPVAERNRVLRGSGRVGRYGARRRGQQRRPGRVGPDPDGSQGNRRRPPSAPPPGRREAAACR